MGVPPPPLDEVGETPIRFRGTPRAMTVEEIRSAIAEIGEKMQSLVGTGIYIPLEARSTDGIPITKAFLEKFLADSTPGEPYVIPTEYGPACFSVGKRRASIVPLTVHTGVPLAEMRKLTAQGGVTLPDEPDKMLESSLCQLMISECILATYLVMRVWDETATMIVEASEPDGDGIRLKWKVLASKGVIVPALRDTVSERELDLIDATGWGKVGLFFRGVGMPPFDAEKEERGPFYNFRLDALTQTVPQMLRERTTAQFIAPCFGSRVVPRILPLDQFTPDAAALLRHIFFIGDGGAAGAGAGAGAK